MNLPVKTHSTNQGHSMKMPKGQQLKNYMAKQSPYCKSTDCGLIVGNFSSFQGDLLCGKN